MAELGYHYETIGIARLSRASMAAMPINSGHFIDHTNLFGRRSLASHLPP